MFSPAGDILAFSPDSGPCIGTQSPTRQFVHAPHQRMLICTHTRTKHACPFYHLWCMHMGMMRANAYTSCVIKHEHTQAQMAQSGLLLFKLGLDLPSTLTLHSHCIKGDTRPSTHPCTCGHPSANYTCNCPLVCFAFVLLCC